MTPIDAFFLGVLFNSVVLYFAVRFGAKARAERIRKHYLGLRRIMRNAENNYNVAREAEAEHDKQCIIGTDAAKVDYFENEWVFKKLRLTRNSRAWFTLFEATQEFSDTFARWFSVNIGEEQ